MNNRTFLIIQTQYDWLASYLPQPRAATGRRAIPNRAVLNGVLYVMKTGCRWQDMPATICDHSPSTCWRRLRYWQRHRSVLLTWQSVLILLDREGQLDLTVGNIDGSLVQSPRFRDSAGYSGKHHRTGTNVVIATERAGVPLANAATRGNRHDLSIAERVVAQIRVGAKRRVRQLNGDKGFDSRPFRRAMRQRGIHVNAPERQFKHRRKRGRKPVYDQAVSKCRPFVERTIAWLKSFRRLRYRWERTKRMFQAMLDFGCLIICLRKVRVLQ